MAFELEDKTTCELNALIRHSRESKDVDVQRVYIVFSNERETTVASLNRGGSIVVGRATPSDVLIADPSISRQHARFSWKEGQITVQDLGSRNGTLFGDQVISLRTLHSGDEVVIGGVIASVHVARPGRAPVGIESYDRLALYIECEVERARVFNRPFALIAMRSHRQDHDQDMEWLATLRGSLRSVDRVALYGPGIALILMPEVQGAMAEQVCQAILEEHKRPVFCGIAAFPGVSPSAEMLIAEAICSARKASQRQPIVSFSSTAEPETEVDEEIVIASDKMKDLFHLIDRVKVANFPVLILGETGVGKEVVARAIHSRGSRSSGPLHIVNCAAIPATLTESMLFGHERGAFTGAEKRFKGVFEQAHGGTVFLDEVGELSDGAQASLLRVLETHRLTRLGASEEIEVDVRVIAATNRDLYSLAAEGTFRDDLIYRLDALTLLVPPLRERTEEIAPLARLFVKRASVAWGLPERPITKDALALLENHSWPGNVRQLRNVIERALVLCAGEAIVSVDLPGLLGSEGNGRQSGQSNRGASLPDMVHQYERNIISEALNKTGGNQSQAARLLGIARRTLVNKIQTYGLNRS